MRAIRVSETLRVLFVVCASALAISCADGAPDDAKQDPDELAQWNSPISEENARPTECRSGPIDMVECTGKYCDNVRIHCNDYIKGKRGAPRWLPGRSEEDFSDPNFYSVCKGDEVITGFTCAGKYCDTMSVQCAKFDNLKRRLPPPDNNTTSAPLNCTGLNLSEEEVIVQVPLGHQLFGLRCEGGYCDNMFLLFCPYDEV